MKGWKSIAKPGPVREGKRFSKQAFTLDWERQIIWCPAEQEVPFVPGGVVHFPKEMCLQCPLKAQCTTSAKGRCISIHLDEALLIELRERQQTSQGRARLRERVAVDTPSHMLVVGMEGSLPRCAQESLRFAPLRRRLQFTCPRSQQLSAEHQEAP